MGKSAPGITVDFMAAPVYQKCCQMKLLKTSSFATYVLFAKKNHCPAVRGVSNSGLYAGRRFRAFTEF
jgi:hypothetical protein